MPPAPTPRSLPAAVTIALVSGDMPDATGEELAAAAGHVERSIAGMPDAMRAGVHAVSGAAWLALLVLGGRPFARLPPARQRRLLGRVASLPLPGVAEFIRLTRGLGLVAVFEARAETAGADGAAAGRRR